jgi:hypothetical protein
MWRTPGVGSPIAWLASPIASRSAQQVASGSKSSAGAAALGRDVTRSTWACFPHCREVTGDPGVGGLYDEISCPSRSFCAGVENAAGDVLTSTHPVGGVPQGGKITPVHDKSLDAISGPSNALCVLTDESGDVISSRHPRPLARQPGHASTSTQAGLLRGKTWPASHAQPHHAASPSMNSGPCSSAP